MPGHIYERMPKFCSAIKPREILLKGNGPEPVTAYLGPEDRDERAALLRLLQEEVDRAAAILAGRR